MKLPTLLLAGSLAANAAFIALVVRPSADFSSLASRTFSGTHQDSPIGAATAAVSAAHGDAWARVQTDDLHALVARLRLAGFPETVIRAILAERLKEQFAARRKAITGEPKDFQFWKSGSNFWDALDPKQRTALRDLDKEQTAMMKDLLGANSDPNNEMMDGWRRRQYGDLPKEKTDQLAQIAQDYSELADQVRAEAKGLILPEDRAKLAYLDKEKQADLAAVLTPEEMEDYAMHSSPTANRLRMQLSGLDVTEDQYRTIFKFTQAFDEKYNPNGGTTNFMSTVGQSPQQLAQNDLVAQVKAALGEPLGTDYAHAIDPNYQTVSLLVARLNLPSDSVDQVLSVQKDIEQRSQALRTDRTLAPADRAQQLAALSQEATQKITSALGGPQGLEAYKQNGGYWLQNLTPRPAVTAGPRH